MRSVRVDRTVAAWTAAGLLACVAYPLLGADTVSGAWLWDVLAAATLVAVLAGIRRNRPELRLAWYAFAGSVFFRMAGDISYDIDLHVLHRDPFPSLADVFYLASCPLLILSTVMLARGRLLRDLAGRLDAAIIATGLGLVWWVFVIGPVAADGSIPPLERLIGAAYPAFDLLLLALVARLLTRSGRASASLMLITAGTAAMLLSDVAFQLVSVYAPTLDGSISAGWMVGNVFYGAAALHRSAGAAAQQPRTVDQRLGRGRLVLLAACTLLVPALLFIEGATGSGAISWPAIGVGAVLLFLLVLARMSGFVTQIQRQAGQLEDLALRDALTGLPNRRVFERRLGTAVASGSPQVAVLDLNGFKDVNDRLGHAVGDRLLEVVAGRLLGALRDGDLVARMGGDEFAVLVPGGSVAVMDQIVGRIATALREPITLEGQDLLVGASIGTADGEDTADGYEVLRRADVAMYAAKQAGERHRRYSPDLDVQAAEEARTGAELRTALDEGQFHLVYQPVVSLPDHRMVAVEALVRWDHPVRGTVAPADFLPVAERSGLIIELGDWILRTACAQAAGWLRTLGAAAPGRLHVNVSDRQLADPGFPALVAATLAETRLPADHLTLEVSETALIHGGEAVRALDDLRALGVPVALDDFGTGHSSLGLLQAVPVDVIKVDKSFIASITRTGRHAVIATALLQVSDGLGLAAVAEGVETAEQAAELHRIGYRFAQGHLFGEPSAEPRFHGTGVVAGTGVATVS
ncbi:putative bifunctional diguanylate cyclase/phosphodiesterase [Couchioplanes caeruleus]|uniref:Diguanylate cyclase n=2 Tax=Couchioplanes caeruleus TaxID=56438 RepID=A0A1K0FM33_9ACTN|nr:EAL domain-containing protein [Couchioplanes caeruleus]OJF13792.1 diguanylate cyclase [Couchioplanes caeruleus subsp. caeruleus]ROP34318.1 diguanylate cyclase (GGDEF)-like protein [Couchioplanes caeruleus]